jgi:peptidyl-prolyl cis-trans isomerase SurA
VRSEEAEENLFRGSGKHARWACVTGSLLGCFILGAGGVKAQGNAQPGAAGDTLESVLAVVENRPILRSEVEDQFQVLAPQFQISPGDTASSNQLRRDILGRMIDDEILVLEAESRGIELTDDELNQTVEKAVEDNKQALGGEQAFQKELKNEGLTLDQLKDRFRVEARRQGLAARLIQREIRPKVTVTDEDVRNFYNEHRDELPKKPRSVRLQDIFIQVRPDSVLDSRARERAQEVRKQIVGGLDFAEAAKRNSDDPSGDSGGKIGRIQRGQLDPALEAAAFALPVGVTSEPIRTAFGYNLLMVDDKDPEGKWVSANIILFQVTPTRSDEAAAENRALEAWKQVTQGGLDFTEAVHRYSEDERTRSQDGNLGWISMEGFAGKVKETIDTLSVGEVSRPVAGDNGYHVFLILEEKPERDFQYDEIRDDLRQYAFQSKMEEKLRAWLDQLRGKYFVENRAGF